MKRILVILILVGAAYAGIHYLPKAFSQTAQATQGNQTISDAFKNRQSGIQVTGEGKVDRILADDNDGKKHQRFILKLTSGQTLLIAHNIDLAPRIDSLKVGDTIAFKGEYIWNDKGGIVHRTHHDPRGKHVGGWLKKGSKTYQ